MFERLRKLRHKCPTKIQLKSLIDQNILLINELDYEARRRHLAEKSLQLEMNARDRGVDNNYV